MHALALAQHLPQLGLLLIRWGFLSRGALTRRPAAGEEEVADRAALRHQVLWELCEALEDAQEHRQPLLRVEARERGQELARRINCCLKV